MDFLRLWLNIHEIPGKKCRTAYNGVMTMDIKSVHSLFDFLADGLA